jgi:L-amino acid N-acyltransferase YncA
VNQIRLATYADAEAILAIYAPIVRDTAISFELEPPSVTEVQQRIVGTSPILPWLVHDSDGSLVGYAYASRHRERAAYQWAVDVSVYVTLDMRRHGLGRSLYGALLSILRDLGYYTAFAGIALPNQPSVKFHEALGFRPVGVYRNVGFKLDRWQDVGWWGRPLRAYEGEPEPPRAMNALRPEELHERLEGRR